MSIDFKAAMRRATERVRRRDVAGATRLIQEALGIASARAPRPAPGPERQAAPAGRPPGDRGRPRGLLLDPAAEIVEPADAAPAPRVAAPRMRLPLGDVLRLLREGRKAHGPAPRRGRAVPAVPEGARYEWRSHACAAGARDYRLYVPSTSGAGVRGIVVMLHGCRQDPDDFAVGTAMNALAEAERLVVAYPGQRREANTLACWNWFNPGDQRRDAGEPAILAGITRALLAEFGAGGRAMVAGLSAGGAMAAVMGATYPELFDAVGIHSGLPYGAANDVASAFAAMRGETGPALAAPVPPMSSAPACRTIVFHGAADRTVDPSNAERIVAAAGGRAVLSEAGSRPGGRAWRRERMADTEGIVRMEVWRVEGAGHAWSGGRPEGSYTDPAGPDASAEMVRFFLEGL